MSTLDIINAYLADTWFVGSLTAIAWGVATAIAFVCARRDAALTETTARSPAKEV